MNLSNKISRQKIVLVTILSIIVSLVLLFAGYQLYFVEEKKIDSNSFSIKSPANQENSELDFANIGTEMRLKIPSIDIDVTLENVGITSDGTMDIPKNTDEAGWFELGKRPGEIGSAVIAGHYGVKNGKPSVFDNLNKLNKGDKISIKYKTGETVSFIVMGIKIYDPSADAIEVFSSDDEKSHLNLITCEGTWNKDAKSFSKRLVVFSDRE